jgi:hypothetical protein
MNRVERFCYIYQNHIIEHQRSSFGNESSSATGFLPSTFGI